MNGKQLKAWAATLHDEEKIEVKCINSYGCWYESFSLRATLRHTLDSQEEEQKATTPIPEPVME